MRKECVFSQESVAAVWRGRTCFASSNHCVPFSGGKPCAETLLGSPGQPLPPFPSSFLLQESEVKISGPLLFCLCMSWFSKSDLEWSMPWVPWELCPLSRLLSHITPVMGLWVTQWEHCLTFSTFDTLKETVTPKRPFANAWCLFSYYFLRSIQECMNNSSLSCGCWDQLCNCRQAG